MNTKLVERNLSSPISTGGGGEHFESSVQALFVILMLIGGFAPCLPNWPIVRIKLQGKVDGYETDDLIVFVRDRATRREAKLLGQIKRSISITIKSHEFSEVITGAWKDYQNHKLFNRENDKIILITGPLSKTDYDNVQWLLEQAKHQADADSFFRYVEQARFSPQKSVEKLAAIIKHLTSANGDQEISKEELFAFLRCFYILSYDLCQPCGVVLPLVNSHIARYRKEEPHLVWHRVVGLVQEFNQCAGVITPENMPSEITDAFKQSESTSIPEALLRSQTEVPNLNWSQSRYAKVIAVLVLIGAWNEKNQADIAILKTIFRGSDEWMQEIKEIVQLPNSPLSLTNGNWKVQGREEIWATLGSFLFDQDLDAFRTATLSVLNEIDPVFMLPINERFTAGIHGKVLAHSNSLRQGLVGGLVLLSRDTRVLTHCSWSKRSTVAGTVVDELFQDADWVLWGSLNRVLTGLAEAAPQEFLFAVENALKDERRPFLELFNQEGDTLTGVNYLTGLLSSLEMLAWDEEYFQRTIMILGELAVIDPGGKSSNRPENSITTILLPWLPQTNAPLEKHVEAVRCLCKESPSIGWRVIINLLQNDRQIAFPTQKPIWIASEANREGRAISVQEYEKQVSMYAELSLDIAGYDTIMLAEMVDSIDRLPRSSFDRLIGVLCSDQIVRLTEDKRLIIWERLTSYVAKNRRFADSKWALSESELSSLEKVIGILIPNKPSNKYRYLFSHSDFDLYTAKGGWDQQQSALDKKRESAIKEIINDGAICELIHFAMTVESSEKVGFALGGVDGMQIDSSIIPTYLDINNATIMPFLKSFVRRRYDKKGWLWVDGFDRSLWSNEQVTCFLLCMPFKKGSWDRASQWLSNKQKLYWAMVEVDNFRADEEYSIAAERLIEHNRPYAAISCLASMLHKKLTIDEKLSVKALLSALTSTEAGTLFDRDHIVDIIRFLQTSQCVDTYDLLRVEWAYLPLLDYLNGVSPITLEKHLSNSPSFFCEVVRLAYRSSKKDRIQDNPTEINRYLATNAARLLFGWRLIPGTEDDGSINGDRLSAWLEVVEETCLESGHIEVALISIGSCFVYSPADKDGLWIDHSVAKALNERDADHLREGYITGLFNRRGVHTVNSDGSQEIELAVGFKSKADSLERAGYQRLANEVRSLAKRYEVEAEKVKYEGK